VATTCVPHQAAHTSYTTSTLPAAGATVPVAVSPKSTTWRAGRASHAITSTANTTQGDKHPQQVHGALAWAPFLLQGAHANCRHSPKRLRLLCKKQQQQHGLHYVHQL
jgi:hypothetical protein